MNRIKKIFLALSLVIVVFVGIQSQNISTLSQFGSRGDEVKKIQQRLKIWGYYNGSVDGVYGKATENAVIAYQRSNGLQIDGIAGSETLQKMGVPSGGSSNASSASENDVNLLARLINAEARGEPYTGQVAVGAVVLNRVKHPSFPNTISGVIFQPGAFTAITDGQWYANMDSTAYKAAKDALNGWDPSNGAIYYYNPAKTTNQWIYSRPVVANIGDHVFAK